MKYIIFILTIFLSALSQASTPSLRCTAFSDVKEFERLIFKREGFISRTQYDAPEEYVIHKNELPNGGNKISGLNGDSSKGRNVITWEITFENTSPSLLEGELVLEFYKDFSIKTETYNVLCEQNF